MRRYDVTGDMAIPQDDGRWVEHTDHLAAMHALRTKLDEANARAERLRELALAGVRPASLMTSPESVRWFNAHHRCHALRDFSTVSSEPNAPLWSVFPDNLNISVFRHAKEHRLRLHAKREVFGVDYLFSDIVDADDLLIPAIRNVCARAAAPETRMDTERHYTKENGGGDA